MHERVAGIDVHKEMVKVAIRSPGDKPWTRKTEIVEFRTFYGVLQHMAGELRRREVTHVVMEASGVYTEPVYYALCEQDFEQIAVINPAHAKALKGHKTDAKDCARLAELFECGLLRGSYIPAPELKEVRDLTRYRTKTVQARTSEIQRLGKALESAGIKLGSVASDITGKSATLMIEALIDGERRGGVLADLAIGRMRTAGKLADLSQALAGRFTEHHALLCRLHQDRITGFSAAVDDLDQRIAGKAARWQREAGLLTSVPGFGDIVAWAWLGEIGPAPTCGSPATRSSPPGSPCARATTSAPASASAAGPAMPAPTSSRCWSRPPGRRSGSGVGCRPGTTGWSAASAERRIRARRRRRSPRSRTPC
jgi:transposase